MTTITPIIDKNVTFFYWLQVISGWDTSAAVDKEIYEYYHSFVLSSNPDVEPALAVVKQIIKNHDDPRKLLRDLYSNNSSNSAVEMIIDASHDLRSYFEILWDQDLSYIQQWHDALRRYNFDTFRDEIEKVARFMDSSFDNRHKQIVYLLPNAPNKNTVGHKIKDSNFILLRPPCRYYDNKLPGVVNIVLHELLHDIEFRSSSSRTYMEQAYNEHIAPFKLQSPAGYTWKEMFIESIIYCFANNITGGYFRPEVFGKPRPSIEEFEKKFSHFFEKNGLRSGYVIAWVALCILPTVEKSIYNGSTIEKGIFDIVAKEFYKKYLTKKKHLNASMVLSIAQRHAVGGFVLPLECVFPTGGELYVGWRLGQRHRRRTGQLWR